MILYARRMVWGGQSFAVNSKCSIDLKTQFVAHVLIRYSILPRPSFINKWFCCSLEVSLNWGENGNTLRSHQWFCMLERLSEEDKDIPLIQSIQLIWKLNLLPTWRSGTPFCRGLLLSTNDFVVVWTFLWVWERAVNTLCIDQRFYMLEGWSEEDRAMLLIQSVQLTWKLNLLRTCQSGTPFCQGLHLSTNDFVMVWLGREQWIHSVSTNDFVC